MLCAMTYLKGRRASARGPGGGGGQSPRMYCIAMHEAMLKVGHREGNLAQTQIVRKSNQGQALLK